MDLGGGCPSNTEYFGTRHFQGVGNVPFHFVYDGGGLMLTVAGFTSIPILQRKRPEGSIS